MELDLFPKLYTNLIISVRWITKTIAEDLDREQLLKVTLREFLIYFVFVIIVTICKEIQGKYFNRTF